MDSKKLPKLYGEKKGPENLGFFLMAAETKFY